MPSSPCPANCTCGKHNKPQRVRICGVYAILNTETGDMYIGSSTDIVKRFDNHISRMKTGYHTKAVNASVSLYGMQVFAFLILEECSKDDQYEKEQFWLQTLMPSFNETFLASFHNKGISLPSPMKGRHQTEHTRQLVSQSLIGNKRSFGKKLNLSDEERQRRKEQLDINRRRRFK